MIRFPVIAPVIFSPPQPPLDRLRVLLYNLEGMRLEPGTLELIRYEARRWQHYVDAARLGYPGRQPMTNDII